MDRPSSDITFAEAFLRANSVIMDGSFNQLIRAFKLLPISLGASHVLRTEAIRLSTPLHKQEN